MSQQINVPLDKTSGVVCEKCGNDTFVAAALLRKVSKFITGDSQDGLMPIQVFPCLKCNHVNAEFIPLELRTTYAEVVE